MKRLLLATLVCVLLMAGVADAGPRRLRATRRVRRAAVTLSDTFTGWDGTAPSSGRITRIEVHLKAGPSGAVLQRALVYGGTVFDRPCSTLTSTSTVPPNFDGWFPLALPFTAIQSGTHDYGVRAGDLVTVASVTPLSGAVAFYTSGGQSECRLTVSP